MFIKKSFVDEIANSMERHLVDGAINKQAELQEKLVKAADYLNAAAEIFDESGMIAQSEVITVVLESLAAKKSKKDKNKAKDKKSKKPAPKKPAKKKSLTSEKMVNNLKEKGWMFDESDSDDRHCADDNCAMCGDMSYGDDDMYAADNNDELYPMLQDFKEKYKDMDFEDELDFDDFEDRVTVHDPFAAFEKLDLEKEEF